MLQFQLQYRQCLLGGDPEDIPEAYKEQSPLYNSTENKTPLFVHILADSFNCLQDTLSILADSWSVRPTGPGGADRDDS
jgi:hypothetical protein